MASPVLTVADFLCAFDAFSEADEELVQAKLNFAHAAYLGCVDFPQYLDIVGNHTAHLIASSPGGQAMRLGKNSAETIYSVQRDQLLRGIPASGLVAR